MCQCTLFDVGGVEIHSIECIEYCTKDQRNVGFGKQRLRAFQPYHQILCILKHVGDVGDRSSTPKGCNAIYVRDVRDRNNLQYTQYLMVWLESPKSRLSKTFFGLKIH